GGRNAQLVLQILLHVERVLDRRGVDDSRSVQVALEDRFQDLELVGFFFGAADAVDQIRPVETFDDRLDVRNAQLVQDVLAYGRRGGGGEREHRGMSEPFDDVAQRQIRGPEVVAPLADAVRFVDDEQRNANRLQ